MIMMMMIIIIRKQICNCHAQNIFRLVGFFRQIFGYKNSATNPAIGYG